VPVRREDSFTRRELSQATRGLTLVAMDLELLGRLVAVIIRARRVKCPVKLDGRVLSIEDQCNLLVSWMYVRSHGLHRSVIEGGVTEIADTPASSVSEPAVRISRESKDDPFMFLIWMMVFLTALTWQMPLLVMMVSVCTIVSAIRYGVVSPRDNMSVTCTQTGKGKAVSFGLTVGVLIALPVWILSQLSGAGVYTYMALAPFCVLLGMDVWGLSRHFQMGKALKYLYQKVQKYVPQISISFRQGKETHQARASRGPFSLLCSIKTPWNQRKNGDLGRRCPSGH
jgi:hypothetical protein